jgi:sugar phosphate permease
MAEQMNYSLPEALSRVVSDFADLMQKEMRLAKAEIMDNVSLGIRAGVWMSIAALSGTVAFLLLVQAAVLGLSAATGMALHWSSVIVAGIFGLVAAAAYAKAKSDTPQLTPDRTIEQVKQDIAVAKEQFS